MEILKKYIDFCIDHKWFLRIVSALVLLLHVICNTIWMGKPVPISHITLTETMAYVNVILVGIWTGVIWVITRE